MSTAFSQSVINKALTTRPWVRKVRRNKYRVTPRTAGHGKYELEVSWDEQGNPTVESCVDYRTKEECLGFKFNGGRCYHSARLLIHLIPKSEAA
jgi:hypothetical protein